MSEQKHTDTILYVIINIIITIVLKQNTNVLENFTYFDIDIRHKRDAGNSILNT